MGEAAVGEEGPNKRTERGSRETGCRFLCAAARYTPQAQPLDPLTEEWQEKAEKTVEKRVKWGKKMRKFHSGISMTTMLLPLLFWFYICGI